jgi:hypothetical protein
MQQDACMRTTLDLPDELLKRSKIEAVERGISLKELVATALGKEIGRPPAAPAPRRVRFPIFSSEAPGSLDLTSADLARAERDEDRRRGAIPR